MNDMNKQQQSGVTAHQQQVQLSHNGNDQVASSNTSMIPTSTMVMAAPHQTILPQQAMQTLQNPTITQMPSHGGSTTITTMSTGPPQQMADWQDHGRVQVIQQPIQNPTYMYNAQGQLIVPGNIALHPGNMNQPIQVITAGKAFQPGQMPHMLTTTQGKQLVQGQATSFPGYATIPTSGNNQTLVISPLGVLGQANILQQQQQQQQAKPQEMQKILTKTSVANTCNTQQQRAVPQGTPQAMQFAPWQATFGATGLPQGLTWAPGTIQGSALLTQGSQILIRNPQHDQTGMFIHNAQATAMPQQNQTANTQPINKPTQAVEVATNVQPKTAIPKTFSAILPNSMGPQNIRPASGTGTHTGQTQTTTHQGSVQSIKTGTKVRMKNVNRAPNMTATQKTDAANQTKSSSVQVLQPKLVLSNVQPGTTVTATVQGTSPDKVPKQFQTQHIVLQQQQHPQITQTQPPPLAQIQQMQTMIPEQIEQKPQPGQLVMSNGMPNAGVVSMPAGQMTPIMGNMIVQAVPGLAPISSGLPIPSGQNVQGVPIAQEIVQTPNPVSLGTQIKQMSREQKENTVQENGGAETGPGRPVDENTSCSEEESAGGNSTSDSRTENLEETEAFGQKSSDKGDKKVNDKESSSQPKAMVMVKPQVLTHVIEGFVIQESSEPFPTVNRNGVDGLLRKMPMNEVFENGEPPKKKSLSDNQKEMQNENSVNPLKWTVTEVCEFIRNLPGCADYVEDFAMQDIDGEALMLLKADHLMSAMSMKLGPAVKIIAKIDTMRVNNPSKEAA